jgi:hypothetical protein
VETRNNNIKIIFRKTQYFSYICTLYIDSIEDENVQDVNIDSIEDEHVRGVNIESDSIEDENVRGVNIDSIEHQS